MEESLRLWANLREREAETHEANTKWLAHVEPAIAVLHDLPNALATLPGFNSESERVKVAGACLQRALDDLRAMWILLNIGYTPAAAAACADLWEHAMLASCAALSDEVALQFSKDEPDDRSLSPAKLSQRLQELFATAAPEEDPPSPDTRARFDESRYVVYKWLCQVKHPTARALRHTVGAALNDAGLLGLTASPDATDADKSVKSLLLTVAFALIQQATGLFRVAAVGDNRSRQLERWQLDLKEARDHIQRVIRSESLVLPWSVGDTKAGKRARSFDEAPSAP